MEVPMELSNDDRHRMAGLLMQCRVMRAKGKDLEKGRMISKLQNACVNVPSEFTATLKMNLGTYIDELLTRCLGIGDHAQSDEWFGEMSYVALIILRYAEEDSENLLSVHARRRLYRESVQGYSKKENYAFFRTAALQLLEFMAPRSDDK